MRRGRREVRRRVSEEEESEEGEEGIEEEGE